VAQRLRGGDAHLLVRLDAQLVQFEAEGGLLELRLVDTGDLVTYSAASEVSQTLLERFRAYL